MENEIAEPAKRVGPGCLAAIAILSENAPIEEGIREASLIQTAEELRNPYGRRW